MKRAIPVVFLFFLLLFGAKADVTINITADRPGGWEDYPAQFHLTCVNPFTGEIVASDWKIDPGESNSFKIDKNEHPQVVCWIFKYGGPMVARKKIETRHYYENGYAGNRLVIPSDSDIGECGDGQVSKYEACDSDSDCSSPTPKCYDCEFCGCASDNDCPQPSGNPQCGFGKCSPEEKPYDLKNNCIYGKCIFSYKCKLDSSCIDFNESSSEQGIRLDGSNVAQGSVSQAKNQTRTIGSLEFETKISNMSILVNGQAISTDIGFTELEDGSYFFLSRMKNGTYSYYILLNETVLPELNKKTFESHGGSDLERIINYINSNIEYMPEQIVSIFGNERINVYLDSGPDMFMQTIDNTLVEMGTGKLENPTMNVYTDVETMLQIQEGSLEFFSAINSGKIRYEGVGFAKSIQMFFMNLAMNIARFFGIIEIDI